MRPERRSLARNARGGRLASASSPRASRSAEHQCMMCVVSTLTYRLSFRLWHPRMPVDEISRRLGSNPDRGWTAGDPRTTPRGRALPGLWKESYWAKGVDSAADLGPQEAIAHHL